MNGKIVVLKGGLIFFLLGWVGLAPISAQQNNWGLGHVQPFKLAPAPVIKKVGESIQIVHFGQEVTFSKIFFPTWRKRELPTFCRIECAVERKTAVPIKFRLGSVQYVDWLEGKPNSGIYPLYIP